MPSTHIQISFNLRVDPRRYDDELKVTSIIDMFNLACNNSRIESCIFVKSKKNWRLCLKKVCSGFYPMPPWLRERFLRFDFFDFLRRRTLRKQGSNKKIEED